jgi:hypothetical protein
VPEPAEQCIIQRMKELRARGTSLRTIATTLEGEGQAVSESDTVSILPAVAAG